MSGTVGPDETSAGHRSDSGNRNSVRGLREGAKDGSSEARLGSPIRGRVRLQVVPLRHLGGPQCNSQCARGAGAGHARPGVYGQWSA